MVGGVLINGAVLAVIVLIYQHAVGHNWAAQPVLPEQHRDPDKLALPGGVPPAST